MGGMQTVHPPKINNILDSRRQSVIQKNTCLVSGVP